MHPKIFISSSAKDTDLANDLARRLRQVGADVFHTETSIHAGEGFVTKVSDGLRDSDEVVVLLSGSSIDSPSVMTEMGAAFGLHKRVTPIIVGIDAKELPPILKNLRYLRYSDLEEYLGRFQATNMATNKAANQVFSHDYRAPGKKFKTLAERATRYESRLRETPALTRKARRKSAPSRRNQTA